jgi:hypothetical protein
MPEVSKSAYDDNGNGNEEKLKERMRVRHNALELTY